MSLSSRLTPSVLLGAMLAPQVSSQALTFSLWDNVDCSGDLIFHKTLTVGVCYEGAFSPSDGASNSIFNTVTCNVTHATTRDYMFSTSCSDAPDVQSTGPIGVCVVVRDGARRSSVRVDGTCPTPSPAGSTPAGSTTADPNSATNDADNRDDDVDVADGEDDALFDGDSFRYDGDEDGGGMMMTGQTVEPSPQVSSQALTFRAWYSSDCSGDLIFDKTLTVGVCYEGAFSPSDGASNTVTCNVTHATMRGYMSSTSCSDAPDVQSTDPMGVCIVRDGVRRSSVRVDGTCSTPSPAGSTTAGSTSADPNGATNDVDDDGIDEDEDEEDSNDEDGEHGVLLDVADDDDDSSGDGDEDGGGMMMTGQIAESTPIPPTPVPVGLRGVTQRRYVRTVVRGGVQTPIPPTLAPVGTCNNECRYNNDAHCDDGRPGADSSLCDPGTDCTDCGPTRVSVLVGTCNNECRHHNNGKCQDGRLGAYSSWCVPGTDCADCGPWGQTAEPTPIPTPAPVPVSVGTCNNVCYRANNGICEDGRPGADTSRYLVRGYWTSSCDPGTDCADCGPWGDSAFPVVAGGASLGFVLLCVGCAALGVVLYRRHNRRRRTAVRKSSGARRRFHPCQPVMLKPLQRWKGSRKIKRQIHRL